MSPAGKKIAGKYIYHLANDRYFELPIVTFVPLARLRVKVSPAGTVNPFRVIVVQATALATSAKIGCLVKEILRYRIDGPLNELIVAEQAALASVAALESSKTRPREVISVVENEPIFSYLYLLHGIWNAL